MKARCARPLRNLEAQELAGPANTNDSRVKKFEHRLGEAFNFTRPESAILCELLLRGPQTPGELRSRAERMRPSAPGGRPQSPLFDSLDQVHSALQHLMKREPPLVIVLPRQPGTKEARYAQVLSGDVQTGRGRSDGGAGSGDPSRFARRCTRGRPNGTDRPHRTPRRRSDRHATGNCKVESATSRFSKTV